MKEELAGRTRLPGKRWSRGEARGLQGESQGDRSSSQIAEKTDVALKDPAGVRKTCGFVQLNPSPVWV